VGVGEILHRCVGFVRRRALLPVRIHDVVFESSIGRPPATAGRPHPLRPGRRKHPERGQEIFDPSLSLASHGLGCIEALPQPRVVRPQAVQLAYLRDLFQGSQPTRERRG
jgi:hypothetical protein